MSLGNLPIESQQVFSNSWQEYPSRLRSAERIKGTPLMRHYSVFTTAFVWVFVFLLPLCFVDALNWRMVPVVVVISVIFRMLDRAGTFTETPFTDDFNSVPLDAICRTIEIDMLQQIGETDIPSAIIPVDSVLM
jgi:putative membrane protein